MPIRSDVNPWVTDLLFFSRRYRIVIGFAVQNEMRKAVLVVRYLFERVIAKHRLLTELAKTCDLFFALLPPCKKLLHGQKWLEGPDKLDALFAARPDGDNLNTNRQG